MHEADVRLYAELDTDNFKMQSDLFRAGDQSNFDEGISQSQERNFLLFQDNEDEEVSLHT